MWKYGLDVCDLDGGDYNSCFRNIINSAKAGGRTCDIKEKYLIESSSYDGRDYHKMFLSNCTTQLVVINSFAEIWGYQKLMGMGRN